MEIFEKDLNTIKTFEIKTQKDFIKIGEQIQKHSEDQTNFEKNLQKSKESDIQNLHVRITQLNGSFTTENEDFKLIKKKFQHLETKVEQLTNRDDLEKMIQSIRDF